MKQLKRTDLMNMLRTNKTSFFTMLYKKTSGELRKANGRLHVSHPNHTLQPGTGKYLGQSSKEAYNKHFNLKYFDCTVDGNPRHGQTFGKGDFRTAKIANIQEITFNGETYSLID